MHILRRGAGSDKSIRNQPGQDIYEQAIVTECESIHRRKQKFVSQEIYRGLLRTKGCLATVETIGGISRGIARYARLQHRYASYYVATIYPVHVPTYEDAIPVIASTTAARGLRLEPWQTPSLLTEHPRHLAHHQLYHTYIHTSMQVGSQGSPFHPCVA